MRSLTTDWNNASYASATSFTDKKGGVVAIPANEPTKVRSMQDSVNGGDFLVGALTNYTRSPTSGTIAPAATGQFTVTVTNASAVAMEGIQLVATSSDETKATVSPAAMATNASGQVVFTVTGVASGSATITVKTKNGAFSVTYAATIS